VNGPVTSINMIGPIPTNPFHKKLKTLNLNKLSINKKKNNNNNDNINKEINIRKNGTLSKA
jgi:hypothetical protein